MRLSVIGCGYLGAVHAACLADLGHDVVGIDTNADKIGLLAKGEAPFYETGLNAVLSSGIAAGRLSFTTDIAAAATADVHFICVGTPQRRGELTADLTFVDAALDGLLPHLRRGQLVVGKSTVPVGTAARLASLVASTGALLAWNPEFLREGYAVQDTLTPDRLVYGLPGGEAGGSAKSLLDRVYRQPLDAGTPLVVTDYPTAELVKVAANSFLATKISFINAMAEVCDATGGDVSALADAIGHDARIGRRFLTAGIGFGGGCLPKDIRGFVARSAELGVGHAVEFLREVDAVNARSRERMLELARAAGGGSVAGRRIAVLGAAFKPDSDDIRDSPALSIATALQQEGAEVLITDPQAAESAARAHPTLRFAASAEEAAAGADAVLLLTEWDEFTGIDPITFGRAVRERIMLDGRNALDPGRWRAAGWTYRALGRPDSE